MRILNILIIQLFMVFCSSESAQNPYSPRFEIAHSVGKIRNPVLAEASGIAASAANSDAYWVINDSENAAAIFLINSEGELLHYYYLENFLNIDWEDIVLIRDAQSQKNKLVIADIGDNLARRPYVQLIILEEPVFTSKSDTIISDFKTYRYVYEDGSRDAETIIVDPLSDDMYIVSKREANIGMYLLPPLLSDRTDKTDTLKLTARLPFFNVTAGSVSPDGTEILLKNYNTIFYWPREKDLKLHEAMLLPHELVAYKPEPQGEAMSWNRDGSGFFTLSELSFSDAQHFYYFAKKQTTN